MVDIPSTMSVAVLDVRGILCLCSGAPPWWLQWLPFGVCHIQAIQTSHRAVDHIMGPRTHLVSELWEVMWYHSSGGPHHGSMDPSADVLLEMVMSYVAMVVCTAA